MKKVLFLSAILSTVNLFAVTTESKQDRLFNLIYAIGIADVVTVRQEAIADIVNLNDGIFSPLGQALHLLADEENKRDNADTTKIDKYKEIISILQSRGAIVLIDRWDEWLASGRKSII